jgi:LytS/YehU family sensor histidine kinase
MNDTKRVVCLRIPVVYLHFHKPKPSGLILLIFEDASFFMQLDTIFSKRKAGQISLHILFWVIIVTYFAWGFGFGVNYKAAYFNAILYLPGFTFIVYTLIYFLIPRYLIKRKYVQFFIGLILVVAICSAYSWGIELTLTPNAKFEGVTMATGRAILPFIHVAGIAISINLLNYWYRQKQKTTEVQNEKIAAELELLKSQIHPHFLFNTLNNLYSFSLEKSDKAPEIILKLSNLLRFMIYESDVTFIPLQKEISILQQYIDLEQLRYGARLDISFTVPEDLDKKQIAPLLLLPFVENVFKHGINNQTGHCWISFDLRLSESAIYLKLINSKDKDEIPDLPAFSGIGLQNVKKRLELLYPDRYNLTIQEMDEVFIVNLELLVDDKGVSKKKIQKYDLEMLNR